MKAIISRLVIVAALVVLPMPALAGNGPRPGEPAGKPGMQAPGAPGVSKPRPAAKPRPVVSNKRPCCEPQMRPEPPREPRPGVARKLIRRSLLRWAWN